MTASNTDADIATQLHAWAVKEMHFRPQGAFLSSKMPSPDDLKGICRGTQQADLWRYVITHVHSVQTVKKVRGNLQLKSKSYHQPYAVQYKSDKKYMEEHQALMEQRAQLVGEVTTVLSEVQQLEHEIHRVSKDVQKAEREYQQETESLRDLGRKTCLLNVYRAKCRENTAQCNAYSDQIDEKTTTYSKRIMDAALHLRPDDPSTSLGTLLETSAEKQVRETCEMIGKFLQETLQGTFGRDKSAFKMSKDQLWDLVKDTLSGLDIRQVVGSLVHMSREGVHTLREHTLKINISQDAKKLRFKYEKGGILRDISTPPTKLQSVQQLLEECQMKHVMRFVETEKHRNEAHTHIQALEATRTKIIAALKRYFSSIQHGNLGLAVSLVQAKLDLTADTTAKECYRQEAESLKEKVAEGHTDRQTLLTIHRKIQDFTDLARAKQDLIQIVARQNGGAQTRLAAHKRDLTQYIMRSLLDHELETLTVTATLKDSVTAEVEKFVSLALPYLAFIYLDRSTKCGLPDLSIYHNSHPTAIRMRQGLQATLTYLHFPWYKAAECILLHCVRLKQEVDDNEEQARIMRESCCRVRLASGVQTNLDNVTELCHKVNAQDKEELEKLLPLLQKRISQGARASTECIKVKDSVQAWWDQPAQFLTPWLKVDDMTYQQWYNKWRIIATKIRQLYVNK